MLYIIVAVSIVGAASIFGFFRADFLSRTFVASLIGMLTSVGMAICIAIDTQASRLPDPVSKTLTVAHTQSSAGRWGHDLVVTKEGYFLVSDGHPHAEGSKIPVTCRFPNEIRGCEIAKK